jgi:hypothetical protein
MSIYNVFLGAGAGRAKINLVISADTQNYNVKNAAVATGQYRAGFSDVNLNINSGIYVGSTSAAAALTVSGFATGDTVGIINNGVVIGRGGNGGNGGTGGSGATAGQAGGVAVSLAFPTSITNNGTLSGGGGGGGAGQGGTIYGSCTGGGGSTTGSGGGGGAGYDGGSGGSGSNGGSAGTRTAGGAAGTGEGGAGAGGNPGQAGVNGGSSGGAAGLYIQGGQQYATWVVLGTRLGGAT